MVWASELHSDLSMLFLCKHKLPGSPHFCGYDRATDNLHSNACRGLDRETAYGRIAHA
jgi:hypothetical protein